MVRYLGYFLETDESDINVDIKSSMALDKNVGRLSVKWEPWFGEDGQDEPPEHEVGSPPSVGVEGGERGSFPVLVVCVCVCVCRSRCVCGVSLLAGLSVSLSAYPSVVALCALVSCSCAAAAATTTTTITTTNNRGRGKRGSFPVLVMCVLCGVSGVCLSVGRSCRSVCQPLSLSVCCGFVRVGVLFVRRRRGHHHKTTATNYRSYSTIRQQDPEEMVGNEWSAKITIEGASGFDIMCSRCYVSYHFWGEDYNTEEVQQETSSPNFKYEMVHTVNPVTKEFLEFLLEPLHFIVYAAPFVTLPAAPISTANPQVVSNITGELVVVVGVGAAAAASAVVAAATAATNTDMASCAALDGPPSCMHTLLATRVHASQAMHSPDSTAFAVLLPLRPHHNQQHDRHHHRQAGLWRRVP